MADEIHDLLYDADACLQEEIRVAFPGAVIEIESPDMVHYERLSVTIPIATKEWWTFLIRTGWAAVSLDFQLHLRQGDAAIFALMDEVKPGWRTRQSKKAGG